MFAPFARHFLVHSSWPATAPLAPHIESETYPFTVSAFLEPAELIVTMNSTRDRTIQISSNFFIANISSSFAAGAADSEINRRFRCKRLAYHQPGSDGRQVCFLK